MNPPGTNSGQTLDAFVVGGVYNPLAPVLAPGQSCAFQFDINGRLLISGGGGGGGGDVNLIGINGVVPSLTNPLAVELSDGTNPFGVLGNPLHVAVDSGGGSNASVGLTGVPAPTSATEIGIIDGSGNLQGASATNPVPITVTNVSSNMTGTVPGTAPGATTITGGIYNVASPAPTDGQTLPLQLDAVGALKVDIVAGGSSNPTIGTVGATAPTSATEIGLVNSLGQLVPAKADATGRVVIGFDDQLLTVLQEILMETRATRRLLFMLYEESGHGVPTLMDDPTNPTQSDYN